MTSRSIISSAGASLLNVMHLTYYIMYLQTNMDKKERNWHLLALESHYIVMYWLLITSYYKNDPYRSFELMYQIILHQDDNIELNEECHNETHNHIISRMLSALSFVIPTLLSPILSIPLLYSENKKLSESAYIYQLCFITINALYCLYEFEQLPLFNHEYLIISISAVFYLTLMTFKLNQNSTKSFNLCLIVYVLITFWIVLILLFDSLFTYSHKEWYLIIFCILNFTYPGIPFYDVLLIKNYIDDYYKFLIMDSNSDKEVMNKYYTAIGRITEVTSQSMNHSENYEWIQQYKFIKLSLDGKISRLQELDELHVEPTMLTDVECVYIASSVFNYSVPILWCLHCWNRISLLDYYFVSFFECMLVLYVVYLLAMLYFMIASERILSNKMSYIRIRNIHQALRYSNHVTNLSLSVDSLKKDWCNMRIIEAIMDVFSQDVGSVIVSFLLTDLSPW